MHVQVVVAKSVFFINGCDLKLRNYVSKLPNNYTNGCGHFVSYSKLSALANKKVRQIGYYIGIIA